ncbi:hypothetical protein Tco_1447372 [Tanacetum coccineum]
MVPRTTKGSANLKGSANHKVQNQRSTPCGNPANDPSDHSSEPGPTQANEIFKNMHSKEQDSFLSKQINIVDSEFKFGMEIPDTMINDAIMQSAGYKFYQSKKKKSEEDNAQEESKEQQVCTVRRLNIEKDVNTKVKEAFAAKKGQKLKGVATEDLVVQSLLDLQKGSKESRLESIRQEIQENKGEGSSVAKDGELEDFLDTDSDAIARSSWSDLDKDDDMDDAGFEVFMYYKTKELPKFSPISPAITCSSMED